MLPLEWRGRGFLWFTYFIIDSADPIDLYYRADALEGEWYGRVLLWFMFYMVDPVAFSLGTSGLIQQT